MNHIKDIIQNCRMSTGNCIPWKNSEYNPIHLPPDEDLKIYFSKSEKNFFEKNYDIIVCPDLNSFARELRDLTFIRKLYPHGKISVLIEKHERNLVIPTSNMENGNLIELVNEQIIEKKINCVFRSPRCINSPIWDGKSHGKILIISNKGFGDNFYASRYPFLNKNENYKFIFEARVEEFRFMKKCSFYDDVCIKGDSLPQHDYHIEINDLHVNTSLHAPHFKNPPIKNQIVPTKKIKIGFVLEGGIVKIGTRRSINNDISSELFKHPQKIQLYCLQKNNNRSLPNDVIDLSKKINCWIDTASYLKQMDFLISIDTGIVHLAAGMGKNVKVLLNPDHHKTCSYYQIGDRYSRKYGKNLMAYWGSPEYTVKEAIRDIINTNIHML